MSHKTNHAVKSAHLGCWFIMLLM